MPLLEREPYFEMLGSALAQAREGHGRIVLVGGEAGIGKTSLLREFAAQSGRLRTLWGGCEALFTPHPLAPLHDIARQMGGDFPALLGAASDRHEIFNSVLDRFTRLSGPTLMVVEDVHWADEATLDFIKFLGRRLQPLGLVLVISYRDDELHDRHPLRAVLGDLPVSSLSRIQLPYLSAEAVGALARAAGRPATGLYEMTNGNAFFVTEVLAAPEASIPATVRDATLARLSRLSDAARRVSRLVALVPGKAERWLVEAAAAPDDATLQECLNAGMIAYPDYSLGFRHELARRAVADSMSATDRRRLNAEILAALLAQGEDQVAVGRLVHHADQADDSAAVLKHAPGAGERAAAVGSHREAARYFETALRHGRALPDERRAELLERRSYECYMTDQIQEALEARQAAFTLWRAAGSARKEGENLRWLSRMAWFAGQTAAAGDYARRAIEVLEALPPGRELAMAYSNRSQLHMLSNQADASLEWGHKALALATKLGETEIQIHALGNIGASELFELGLGPDNLERSLRMALEGGFEEHASRAYTNLGSAHFRSRTLAAAMRNLNEGIAYCRERDLDSWTHYMLAQRAGALLALGRWDEAADDASSVLRHERAAAIIKIPALVVLGRLRARRGDPDSNGPLDEAYRLALPTDELQRLGPALAALAEAAWLQGAVTEELLTALAALHAVSLERQDRWVRGELAFWLWRHGRPAQSAGVPEAYALQIAGDWQEAANVWEKLECPYEQALALADGDSEPPLRAALAIFERLGANPMAARVRRQLRASGVRGIRRGAQERTRRNPAGMTNQELKVLGLLTEGLRNADIAKRLFVSEKTVGHHVSAVLSKLGVRSRGEAAAAAARLGLKPPAGDAE